MWNGYSFLNVFYILALLCFKNSAFNLPINRLSCNNNNNNNNNNILGLKMGCDYYIFKILRIYYINEPFCSDIILSRENGYYYYYGDEDHPDYQIDHEDYVSRQLELSMRPILVYTNNSYLSENLKNKYSKIIEETIENDSQNTKNIIKVVKVEEREERH